MVSYSKLGLENEDGGNSFSKKKAMKHNFLIVLKWLSSEAEITQVSREGAAFLNLVWIRRGSRLYTGIDNDYNTYDNITR